MHKPRTVTLSPAEAHEQALGEQEPLFIAADVFTDDRGWSIMNQLQGVMSGEGQINFAVQYPQVIKAWHRHQHQTDFWLCVFGHIKVGVYRESDGRAWSHVVGERRPGVMIVPPPLWHGAATVGPDKAGLLYYVTRSYNRDDPDEDRRPFDSIEGFAWQVLHG